MHHTPLTKRMCPRGAYLCSIFQPLTTMKPANAKRVLMRAKVTRLMPRGKRSRLVDGVEGLEERDQTSKRLYGREEKAQKSRSSWPPCFIHGGMRGIPATDLSDQYLWAMPLLPHVDPNVPLPSSPVLPATVEHVKRLVLLASTKPRRHVLMVFLGGTVTALGLLQELHTRNALVRIHIYQSGDTKDGPGACTCHAVHFAHIPSKMIGHISTILSARITTRASDVAPVSVP